MFRTLLRTLPSLSGNVKFNINLEKDYTINNKTILTKVNKAFLTTAGQDKNSFVYNINLLSSRWDYDLCKFYSFYSNQFYKSSFSFIKNDINILDKYNEVKPRDIDFEFGVSRLDYCVYNNQYSFFAPIYVDNVFDLPNQFEITLKYTINGRDVSKKIIVPLRPENYQGLYENDNILYNYLYRYIKRVDSKIINISGKQIKYYGIDLQRGGFNEFSRPDIAKQLFTVFNPLQRTDSIISSGFKMSRSCVKQILPLSFNFNLSDLLDTYESSWVSFTKVNISGAYKYTDNTHQELKNVYLPLYDFDIEVDELYRKTREIDYKTLNVYNYINTDKNILDQDFPGLHDSKFYKYQFSNRISPNYTRWRIQKTNLKNNSVFDDTDYLINFSPVFNDNNNNYLNSINTDVALQSVAGICNIIKYNQSQRIQTPFDIDYNNDALLKCNTVVDLSNLIIPYNKLYYSELIKSGDNVVEYKYKFNDYYKVLNSYLDYTNYINNRKTLIYDHFRPIYLSSEYLESYIGDDSATRKIDLLSQYSYIDSFNLSYVIDDSYDYSLYSDSSNLLSIFDKANQDYNDLWHTPVNDTVFYNGVLYDLSEVYNINTYNKYINTLNDEKYDKIAYTNHILPYLNDKNYENWKETQKITKFGSFYLPIPSISFNDSYLNTAGIALSYTYKNASTSVNYEGVLNSLLEKSASPSYLQIYCTADNNTSISYNIDVIRTSYTLGSNVINLDTDNKEYYIEANEVLSKVINPISNKNNHYINNEYISIRDIFTDIIDSVSECHNTVLETVDFLEHIKLPFGSEIGIHNGQSEISDSVSLNNIKDFLESNIEYQQAFYAQTGIASFEKFNKQVFECIYNKILYYFININSTNIPVFLIDNPDLYELLRMYVNKQVKSQITDVNILIDKFNIKQGFNGVYFEKGKQSHQLNNLYIKKYNIDELIPIKWDGESNYFDYQNIQLDDAVFVYKEDLWLKQEVISICNKLTFTFKNKQVTNNIINTFGDCFSLSDELLNIIHNVYGWLVENNCDVLNKIKKVNFTVNQEIFNDNINDYINNAVASLTQMDFERDEKYSNCLEYIDYLYLNAYTQQIISKGSNSEIASFLLLTNKLTKKVEDSTVYKFMPLLLNEQGKVIAKNIFVPYNDNLFGEDRLIWINKFNIKNLELFASDSAQRFISEYTKTLYSLFVSLDHLKKYMQYIVADENAKYTVESDYYNDIPYYQWIKLDINSVGPFSNLYVVENKIVYNSLSQSYDSLNRYINIKEYLTNNIEDLIRDIVKNDLDYRQKLIRIFGTDPIIIEQEQEKVVSEVLNDCISFFDGYTLFKFVEDLKYNETDYTFTFTKNLGKHLINIDNKEYHEFTIPVASLNFLLAQKADFVPVTTQILSDCWGLFDTQGNQINYTPTDNYVDFYFYYLYPREELDNNLTRAQNGISVILSDGSEYNKYKTATWTKLNVLKPLFNTYRFEHEKSTKLYSEVLLSHIKSFYYNDTQILFKFVTTSTLNTIIQLNKNMCGIIKSYMDNCDDETKDIINSFNIYKKIDLDNVVIESTPHEGNKYDELGLFETNKIYTYYKDGENYGFYINFIKTSQSLVKDLYKFNNKIIYDTDSKTLKSSYSTENSFLAIDNVPLIKYNDQTLQLSVSGAQYMCSKLINLLYFNQNIINNLLANCNTLRLPYNYNIINNLESVKLNYNNLLQNTSEYNIIVTGNKYEIDLIRYTKYIEPNFKEIYNKPEYVYNLKFKETNDNLLKYYIYDSIGDSPIYKSDASNVLCLFGKNAPKRELFDTEEDYDDALREFNSGIYYNNIIERFAPYEFKNFNQNQYYALPKSIVFYLDRSCTYEELINLDKTEIRLERFIEYCRSVFGITNRAEVLFLYNRYTSRLEFVADGLDEYNKNKVYSGKFIFTLN